MILTDFGVTRRSTMLSNGVRLVVFERPCMPVAIRAMFLSGSRYDPPGKEGLAHFTEHMIVSGTKNHPSKEALARYVEQFGAYKNALTSTEVMGIVFDFGDPADFTVLATLLGEFLHDSILDPIVLEKERGAIQTERQSSEANPAQFVHRLARIVQFQGTAVGRSTIGSEESINAINLDDITSYYHHMVSSGRLAIVMSGGVTLEEAEAEFERSLKPFSSPLTTQPERPLPIARSTPLAVKQYRDTEQVQLVYGFRTSAAYAIDEPALQMLGSVLGRGGSSRLFRKLRFETGLVYGVGAGQGSLSDAGTWNVSTACRKEDLNRVLSIIQETLREAIAGDITSEELALAKQRLVKSQRLALQTSEDWADAHTSTALLRPDDKSTILDYLATLQTVTLGDLQRVATHYFGSDAWYAAMCGNLDVEEAQQLPALT
jgi:zinc protease